MTVGNQATVASINNQLTSLALQVRNICDQVQDFQTFVVTTGQSGLETIGFDSADASSVMTMVSYMNTIAGVYYGSATQGSEFDFNNALSELWAGQ